MSAFAEYEDYDALGLAATAGGIGADRMGTVVADVSRPEQNARMIRIAVARISGLGVFVSNAGIESTTATIDSYPIETLAEVTAITVRGVLLGLQCAMPALRQRGHDSGYDSIKAFS